MIHGIRHHAHERRVEHRTADRHAVPCEQNAENKPDRLRGLREEIHHAVCNAVHGSELDALFADMLAVISYFSAKTACSVNTRTTGMPRSASIRNDTERTTSVFASPSMRFVSGLRYRERIRLIVPYTTPASAMHQSLTIFIIPTLSFITIIYICYFI